MLQKCTGVRNRAAPVRKVNYNDSHFISDYTLLEDTGRVIDSAVRTRQSTTPRVNGRNPALAPGISKGRMSMLSKEASKRDINLRFMPRGFARHARNSSHVRSIPEPEPPLPPDQKRDPREKAMYWHLDVYFASCNEKCPGTKLVKVDGCEEEQGIDSILVGATGALRKGRKRKRSDFITCTSKANDGYAKYLDATPKDLVVYLRNEHVLSANSFGSPTASPRPCSRSDKFDLNRYVPIENENTLRQVLSGRSVIEFPVLHVAFKDSKQAKELASATSGIFEKPDESDDSDAASSSDSESGEEDDHVPEPVEPEPPTHESAPTGTHSASFSGISSRHGREESSAEPPLKSRRLESPPSIAPCASHVEDPVVPVVHKELPEDDKLEESSKSGSLMSTGDLAVTQKREGKLKKTDENKRRFDLPNGKGMMSQKESSRRVPLAEELGSSESDSFATDPVGRRGAGMPLDDPYMRDSVKAILETRIPRKRKDDKTAPCSSSSEKQSPSRKLTATGW